MVRIDTILESLVIACRESDVLPGAVTYSTIVLDAEGDHSDVSTPVIEFSVEDISRDQSRNTEKVGIVVNDDGTEEAFIYELWFTAMINAEVFTVEATEYTHRGLESDLQTTLYGYDEYGINNQLPDPDNPTEPLSNVSWLTYEETTPDNDFGFNPSVRTRNTVIDVGFNHEFLSTDFTEHDILETVETDFESVS